MFSELTADSPVAHALPERAINLPSYHDMTDDDQQRVIEVLRALVLKRTRL
jgi:perosamine synthetase